MSIDIRQNTPDQTARRSVEEKKPSLLVQWWNSVIQTWQRQKMIAALGALDDHILRDIGIPRGEIERVVDGFNARELGMQPVAPQGEKQELSYAEFRRAA